MEVYTVKKYRNRTKWFNTDGNLHRADGPAVEWTDGSKEWWIDGLRHMTDGPAIEWTDGSKFWYQNGKYHRTDGPAMELASGVKAWYIDGVEYTEEEFNKKISEMNDPCNGKTVEIDGKKYELKLIN